LHDILKSFALAQRGVLFWVDSPVGEKGKGFSRIHQYIPYIDGDLTLTSFHISQKRERRSVAPLSCGPQARTRNRPFVRQFSPGVYRISLPKGLPYDLDAGSHHRYTTSNRGCYQQQQTKGIQEVSIHGPDYWNARISKRIENRY
jgi:hypothetical protein